MQHLPGLSAGRDDRVIPPLVGVPVAGALLPVAIDLTDKAVHIDDESLTTWAGAGRPGPHETVSQHAVELADVPERERAQKRPQRRRC